MGSSSRKLRAIVLNLRSFKRCPVVFILGIYRRLINEEAGCQHRRKCRLPARVRASQYWKCGRAVYGSGLENQRRETFREFESLRFRQNLTEKEMIMH